MTKQGYSLNEAGVAISAYGIGNLLASFVGGYLADAIGRRKTIVLSMFSGAASMLVLSQARGLPAIVVIAALTGITNELYRPAASALLADIVPSGQRVTAFSAYRMAFNAGWAFGPATAGFLSEHGFFWLFIGDAATSVLFGLVAYFALPRGVRSEQKTASWGEAFGTLRQDRKLHQVLLASAFLALVLFQMNSTFGLYVTHIGFSPAVYGALISMNGALVVFCELPLTTITRRFPAQRVIALGYLLAGLGFTMNMFASSIPMLVLCMVVFTLGEMIAMPVAGAYVADLSPPHMRGRYSGTYGLTWACGLIVGPMMGMRLFAIGPSTLWLTCGALASIASMIMVLKVRAKGLQSAPMPALIRK